MCSDMKILKISWANINLKILIFQQPVCTGTTQGIDGSVGESHIHHQVYHTHLRVVVGCKCCCGGVFSVSHYNITSTSNVVVATSLLTRPLHCGR